MKTIKKAIAISILSGVCGVSMVALAQPNDAAGEPACGHHGKGHLLEKADANSDGKVTLKEMLAAATTRFDQADKNHDGKVTPEERQAKHKEWAEKRFAEADKNHDGALSAEELPGRFGRFMMKADANEDGKLTKAELKAAHEARVEKMKARGGTKGHGPFARLNETQTKEDLKAHVTERFKRMDKNSDGAITQDELRRGGRHHRGGKHGGLGPWGKRHGQASASRRG